MVKKSLSVSMRKKHVSICFSLFFFCISTNSSLYGVTVMPLSDPLVTVNDMVATIVDEIPSVMTINEGSQKAAIRKASGDVPCDPESLGVFTNGLTAPGSPLLENQVPISSITRVYSCLLYTSPSPRDAMLSRMPSSA